MIYTLDSRQVKPGMGFVALKGEKVDGHDFIPSALKAGAADIIDGLDALQERAKAYRRGLKAKVIGVTGSAGKTTTKEFLKAFLACPGTEGNFNNHIGLPLTILNCPENAEFLVVEMGTNHPGEIAGLCDIADPDVGVVVSIGTAHLEFFGSRENIAQEKMTLAKRAKDFSVVPEDAEGNIPPFACPLPGSHNLSNMALAYAVARRLGVSDAICEQRLKNFSLPGARWRKTEKWGVTFIDDTYNANPDSMIAALNAFSKMDCVGRRVAVLGDMLELGSGALDLHKTVFEHAMNLGIQSVIAVGPMASKCRCHAAYDGVQSVKSVFQSTVSPGDMVLLKASHAMNLGDLIA